LIHGRIVTSDKRLLDCATLYTSRTVVVHTTLFNDATVPSERLADVGSKFTDSRRLTLGFHIKSVKHTLRHTTNIH